MFLQELWPYLTYCPLNYSLSFANSATLSLNLTKQVVLKERQEKCEEKLNSMPPPNTAADCRDLHSIAVTKTKSLLLNPHKCRSNFEQPSADHYQNYNSDPFVRCAFGTKQKKMLQSLVWPTVSHKAYYWNLCFTVRWFTTAMFVVLNFSMSGCIKS